MTHRRLRAVVIVVAACISCVTATAFAQVPLSQFEIRLTRSAEGGGCNGCDMQDRHRRSYEIRIHGDGTVEHRSALDPDARHVRIISTDDVIALANQFIAAGFLDANDYYDGKIELIRKDDGVLLQNGGGQGSEAPTTRLTLRLGQRLKEVTLVDNYPKALGRLTDLVDGIGGPQVWTAR